MGLTFGYPFALFGLIFLPVLYVVHRWRPLHAATWARRAALGLRLAAGASLVLALARPTLLRPLDAQAVVFALDVSQSMPTAARAAAVDWVNRALAAMSHNDRAGFVHFAADARLVRALEPTRQAPPLRPGGDGTNVEAAIRVASSAFDRSALRRVVVLSDGAENLGQGDVEARHANGQGIEVSTVPLPVDDDVPEVLLESMESPPRVREGEPVETTVIIYATVDAEAVVRFWTDGRQVSEDAVRLEAGPNRFVYNQGSSFKKGYHSFRARVDSPADTLDQNNELSSFTVVLERAKVLIVEGQTEQGRDLAALLKQGNIDVDQVETSFIPPRLAPVRKYDAMVLYNVPATNLSLDQMKTIQSYVQVLGKGLIAVGGKESFGLGGYTATPLEETLPVSMTPPARRENPSLSLLIVLDKSGSMEVRARSDGRSTPTTKMAMAKEAASLAMDVLDSNDEIGILQFDMTPRWTVPMTTVGDPAAIQRIRDQINVIRADGGTEIFPALQMAYEQIRSARTQLKHVVLLTDGRSFSAGDYERLIAQMRQAGITLSSIAIGSDADIQLLRRLADQGNGRYYFTDEPRSIPKLVTHETATAAANRLVEADFKPRVTAVSPILRNFVGDSFPGLSGYVVTTPKPGSQVVMASHVDDPILAQWQYGLGRAVAFLSALDGTWSNEWLRWDDVQRFWTQTLRWAMPSPLEGNVQFAADLQGKTARLRVEVVADDGSYANLLDTRVQISTDSPNRPEQLQVVLRQTAPGRYEGTTTPLEPGAYAVRIVQREGDKELRNELFGFAVPYSAEFRLNHDGARVLQRIAAAGGGTVMLDPAEAFQRTSRQLPQDRVDLWQIFLGLALVLFPLDVGIRRLWPMAVYLRRLQLGERLSGLLRRPGRVT